MSRGFSGTVILLLAALAPGCQGSSSNHSQESGPFPVEDLANLSYTGTQSGTVQLVAGVWQGEPYEKDGESRPEVDLAAVDPTLGDLNGDGREDAVVVLTEQLGGSGIFVYLAAVVHEARGLRNTATVLLGDRVGISGLTLEAGHIQADLVEAGPEDPACCPSQKVRVRWRLVDARLEEVSREDTGRLEH